MHGGAPAHFTVIFREFLNQQFRNRCIGRGTDVANQFWPPRTLDLNPSDCFMELKALVFRVPENNFVNESLLDVTQYEIH